MNKPLKIVLVGCGQIADGHISEIKKIKTAQIVAVCDLEILMAEQAAIRYEIPGFYSDFEEMLKQEKPDVVHIATPPSSHVNLVKLAVDYDCHVYLEKPIAPTHEDGEEILRYVKEKGKKFTIGWNYYFDPPALRIRELAEQNELGEIVHVDSFFGYGLEGSFGKAILGSNGHWVHQLPGKLFQNNIDHLFNKFVEFIDVDEPEITVSSSRLRERSFGDMRDDMHDELRVFVKGDRFTANCVFSSHIKPYSHYYRVFGTKKIMYADIISRAVIDENGPTFPSAIGRMLHPLSRGKAFRREGWKNIKDFKSSNYHFFVGLNNLISRFYDSIIYDREEPIPYDQILKVSKMIDTVNKNSNGNS